MPSVYVRVSKIKSWIQQNAPGTQDSDCEAHTLPTDKPSSDSADLENEIWNHGHNDDEYEPGNYDPFGSWDDDPNPGNPNKWTDGEYDPGNHDLKHKPPGGKSQSVKPLVKTTTKTTTTSTTTTKTTTTTTTTTTITTTIKPQPVGDKSMYI